MSSNLKSLLFWAVLLVLAGMLFVVVKSGTAKKEVQISLTDFVSKVQDKEVKDVTITGSDVHGDYVQNPVGFTTQLPPIIPKSTPFSTTIRSRLTIKAKAPRVGSPSWCRHLPLSL